jgi:CDGSH-type Zn-finger protein/uncharacterized Fe-S cluster protein YjdI
MNPASHREQLVGMLCEAAEIEHCLMCTYLYAAFSLKQSLDEDLSADELAAVRRWRAEIIRISTDEMLHLALVNNLLISLGARPHYRRFNFPIGSHLFPADIAVALLPFDESTLDHFVYLERPSGAAEPDSDRLEKSHFPRIAIADRLMSFADDYTTVGELYLAIEASFAQLVQSCGAPAVFLGPICAQLTVKDFRLPGLCTVDSMADVSSAIELIRHQGEGSENETSGSHYARFCAIRAEWRRLKGARPEFVPARTVARNPVMRSPAALDRVQVIAEPASVLLDAANAVYGLMLRQLALMSDEALCARDMRHSVGDQTLELMHLVAELGTQLSTLPANPDFPGLNAGMTFTVSRSALSFQSPDSAAAIMAERYDEIATRLHTLTAIMPSLNRYAAVLGKSAQMWRERAGELGSAQIPVKNIEAPTDKPVATAAIAPATFNKDNPDAPPPASGSKIDVARGEVVEVHFDHSRCIHSRHCVLDEPTVFIANKPGEWIYPDTVPIERIAQVAQNCPSGAITYTRLDDGPNELPPAVNVLRLRENGPLGMHATLMIDGHQELRATLCRCGLSKNKPYCDSSHVGNFAASGEPATRNTEPLAARGGALEVTPLHNGPLDIKGNLEICCATGRIVDRITSAQLCRCGQSNNKPFCDGSHAIVGFEASGA